MSVNYTEQQVQHMIEEYKNNPTRETVENLAEELNKSIKSIIGKLSREGVYQKTVYKTKTGDPHFLMLFMISPGKILFIMRTPIPISFLF